MQKIKNLFSLIGSRIGKTVGWFDGLVNKGRDKLIDAIKGIEAKDNSFFANTKTVLIRAVEVISGSAKVIAVCTLIILGYGALVVFFGKIIAGATVCVVTSLLFVSWCLFGIKDVEQPTAAV
jgi:hypothetical protein